MVFLELFVIVFIMLSMQLLTLLPIGNPMITVPQFSVSGHVILSTKNENEQRIYRFFNDVGGEVYIAKGKSLLEATGKIQVSFLKEGKKTVKNDWLHIFDDAKKEKEESLAIIELKDLQGLRNFPIAIGGFEEGRFVGNLTVATIARDFDLPIKILQFDESTYILEPMDGLFCSMEELEISEEVADLFSANQEAMEDKLRIYFKFVLKPKNEVSLR